MEILSYILFGGSFFVLGWSYQTFRSAEKKVDKANRMVDDHFKSMEILRKMDHLQIKESKGEIKSEEYDSQINILLDQYNKYDRSRTNKVC